MHKRINKFSLDSYKDIAYLNYINIIVLEKLQIKNIKIFINLM